MRIKQLSQQLANQIAAGEVVERPASVVKELLENSIDAGADQIKIVLESGGKQLIQIEDNGRGISKTDLSLSVSRHATSKIHQLDDLHTISSLGFRGEALASISSISRLSIYSYEADNTEQQGWAIDTSNDSDFANYQAEIFPSAILKGTRVIVRDLFFNTPARRKFLRADKTEFRHIETMVRRIAIGHPEIAIELLHNKKSIFKLNYADNEQEQLNRLKKLISSDFVQYTSSVSTITEDYLEQGKLVLRGWVADHRYTCINAEQQFFFVNGRFIKDKLLTHALRQAFHQLFPAKEFMAYVLFLELEPSQVDVNVHPTKHEVRFYEARLVHDFIVNALIEVFTLESAPEIEKPEVIGESSKKFTLSQNASQNTILENQCHDLNAGKYYSSLGLYQNSNNIKYKQPIKGFKDDVILPTVDIEPSSKYELIDEQLPENQSQPLQIGDYLFTELDSQLFMIHLMEAASWLNAQKLLQSYTENTEKKLNARQLLIPQIINLNGQKLELFLRWEQQLTEFGIEYSQSGDDRVLLRTLPQVLFQLNPNHIMDDLYDFLNREQSKLEIEKLIQAIAASVDIELLKSQEQLNRVLGLVQNNLEPLLRLNIAKIIDESKLNKLFNTKI